MSAGLIFDSLLVDVFSARLDFGSDTIKVMLVDNYQVDAGHSRRSDITGEVSSGGYAAGGAAIDAVMTGADGAAEIVLPGAVWWQSSVTANGAIYYKARGGGAADDELICYIAFDGPVRSVNGTFFLDKSSIGVSTK